MMKEENKDRYSQWKKIEEDIKRCKKCNLWRSRKNPVVGEGSIESKILLVGEAPGYWEDINGRPFVGRAGKFLDELLEIAGLKREDIYITNVLKCRPPNNRDPLDEEIKACSPYLDKQIEIINPDIIVTVGNFATRYVLNKYGLKSEPISRIHGRVFKSEKTIITMYHPATAVYNPKMKQVLTNDFLILRAYTKGAKKD